jgi:hypothetical protein
MSRSKPARDAVLRRKLDAAVQRLAATRRTFTEDEALASLWEAGYNVSPQDDARFVLGREADGRAPRHWHLVGQVVANNRMIEALEAGTWDGRNVDAELARLDDEGAGHHVFCPADDRLVVHPDGRIDIADEEREVVLPPGVQSALDTLAERLLERWREAGPVPWTARQVTEALADLGWERARARGAGCWRVAGYEAGRRSRAWGATTGCPLTPYRPAPPGRGCLLSASSAVSRSRTPPDREEKEQPLRAVAQARVDARNPFLRS